jgi:phage-related protein
VAGQSEEPVVKPLHWVGSSKDDLTAFPGPARREAGYALYLAQMGMKATSAKPLKGFGGAGVLEVVANHDGNTYRAMYTVKFAKAVFTLHAFQKKSKRGIATNRADIDLVRRRLKLAESAYERLYGSDES